MYSAHTDHSAEQDHVHHTDRSVAASQQSGSQALAQFPAQQALQMKADGSGAVAQLFRVMNILGTNYQLSDSIDLGVSVPDSQYFHAGPDVPVAPNVLKLHHEFDDTHNRIFTMNVKYIKDCGEYANKLLYQIANVNKSTHIASLRTYQMDSPQPGVGEAFYVQSDESQDPEFGKAHFNHHWGVVVAKSGNDVVTAEADSTKDWMAFHMYNPSAFGQSFKEQYMTKGKLDQSARMYLARIEKTERVKESSSSKKDVEVIDLDD